MDADAVLSQAAETASAKPVSDDAVPPTKRMQKLERKSEKAHDRLDAAREKLPTHKVLKKERVFDEETGKGKTLSLIHISCLCEALEVLTAWGFSYKTVAFVWVKQNRRNDDLFTGMG